MPEKRSKRNADPSRGRDGGGICAGGHGDRAALRGFADGGRWRGDAARAGIPGDSHHCSNAVRGRSADRSRTRRDIRLPDKPVDEEPPRHDARGRAGQRRPIMAS
jgi:hypothetical protein